MKFYLTTLFLTLFLLSGCKLNKPDDQIGYNIPDEFQLSITEIRDSATGLAELGLRFKSTSLYDCSGFGVLTNVVWSPERVTIALQDVIKPAVCDGFQAAAEKLVVIGYPKNGNFGCQITLGGVVPNVGSLQISAETVKISFAESAGIVVLTPEFRRMPADAVWGWAGVPNSADLPILQQFLTELYDFTTFPDYKTGIYADFQINSVGHILFQLPKNAGLTTLDFVRKINVSPVELKALLAKYRNDLAHPMTIVLWTTAGKL